MKRISIVFLLTGVLLSTVVFANESNITPDDKTFNKSQIKMAEKIKENGKMYKLNDGVIKVGNTEVTPPSDLLIGEEGLGILAAYDRYSRVITTNSNFKGVASTITFPTNIIVGTDANGNTDILYKYIGFKGTQDNFEAGFFYQDSKWKPFAASWVGPRLNQSPEPNFRWWQSSQYTSANADIKLKVNGTISEEIKNADGSISSVTLPKVEFYINGVIVATLGANYFYNSSTNPTGYVKRLNSLVGYTQNAEYRNSYWRNSYIYNSSSLWYLWTNNYGTDTQINSSFSNTWVNTYYDNNVNLR